MTRMWISLMAVGLVLAGCGGDDGGSGDSGGSDSSVDSGGESGSDDSGSDDSGGGGFEDVDAFEDQLIENGISEDLAGCIAEGLGEAGISADELADAQSADVLAEVTQTCSAELSGG